MLATHLMLPDRLSAIGRIWHIHEDARKKTDTIDKTSIGDIFNRTRSSSLFSSLSSYMRPIVFAYRKAYERGNESRRTVDKSSMFWAVILYSVLIPPASESRRTGFEAHGVTRGAVGSCAYPGLEYKANLVSWIIFLARQQRIRFRRS